VGPVDEEQLFYLQCRGISYQDALHLLVEGFFAQVIERLPFEPLREPLMDLVRAKLGD
jgi:Fe-S cluster assembly protein SufD